MNGLCLRVWLRLPVGVVAVVECGWAVCLGQTEVVGQKEVVCIVFAGVVFVESEAM